MHDPQPFIPSVPEELYARALGWEMLKFARAYNEHVLARQVNTDAVLLLGEIQALLDDATLDDPTCLCRMDAVIQAFHAHGLSTRRHDDG